MSRETQTASVVLATTLVLAFSSLVALFPAAMAPAIAPALGISAATVGLQVSLVFAGATLSSLVAGPLSRRFGPCRASQLALLLLGGGAALASFPAVTTFAFASLITGFGYGLTNPAASLLLVRFAPVSRQSMVFSIKQTGVPLGGILAGASAPLLALLLGWQWGLLILSCLALMGIGLLQLQHTNWDDQRDTRVAWMQTPLAGVALVWGWPALRYLALLSLCFSSIQLSVSAFTVSLLVEDIRFGLVEAGLVMSAVQAAGVTGRVFWGWFADRIRQRYVALAMIACITWLAALGVSLMAPGWSFGKAAALFCVLGFCSLGWNGVYLAQVAYLAPRDRIADASGGSLVFTFGGVLLGLPIFTVLQVLLGSYTALFGILAILAIATLGLVYWSWRASLAESR